MKQIIEKYIEQFPDKFAFHLRKYESEELAQYLQSTSIALLIKLIPHVSVNIAADLLDNMSISDLVKVIENIDVKHLSYLMNFVQVNTKKNILSAMGPLSKIRYHQIANFNAESVGAWFAPVDFVAHLEDEIYIVLQHLRKQNYNLEIIYVLNNVQQISGYIEVKDVFKTNKRLIKEILRANQVEIHSGQNIFDVFGDPCWLHQDIAPVIDVNRKFCGVLRHIELRRALKYLNNQMGGMYTHMDKFGMTGVMDGYCNVVTDLCDFLFCNKHECNNE